MKIIIAGAGDVGSHLAKLLAVENQDITLIDNNEDILETARRNLDVLTIRGEADSFEILREAEVEKANLFIAVTTYQSTNLISALLAKKMGAKQTVARVQDTQYLKESQVQFFKELGIDSLICPDLLAANEIKRLIKQCSLTDIFEFENGKFALFGVALDVNSPIVNLMIEEVVELYPTIEFKPIAILRGSMTIIPGPDIFLRRNDHIYFVARPDQISRILELAGKENVEIKNVMINGGGEMAYRAAEMLEDDYNIVITEEDKTRCKFLAEHLNRALIVKTHPSNVQDLRDEGLERMDAFVALSRNSESNIVNSLIAEESGVFKTIALVSNADYIKVSQSIGVDSLINEKIIAANNIFRFVRKGHIEAIASIPGIEAEVIEFILDKQNRLTRKPISELHMPDKTVIAGVIRGEDSIIPDEYFQLQKGDKVIVFTLPEAIGALEKMFR